MDLAMWIVYGLAAASVGVIAIAVPLRARILELVTERDLWRSRAHAAEGLTGRPEDSDVRLIPQPPRDTGLEMFYGEGQK